MSDPTSQPPLPGRPPAWNTEDEPTLPYGVPPQQSPYYETLHPDPTESQAGLNSFEPSQPYGPSQHNGPTGPGPYAPPSYAPPYGPPPGYVGGQGFPPPPPPPAKTKMPWLLAGAIAVVVALIGGAGVLVVSRTGGDDAAEPPVPSGSYTDGLMSIEPSTEASTEPTEAPSSEPVPSPTPSPTPTEKRRTLKDVDQGIKVYDDVYVHPAKGWRKFHATKFSATLVAEGRGVVYVIVSPVGYPAASAVPTMVGVVAKADNLTGVQKGSVKILRPANSNIGSQAQMAFTGRLRENGVTYSLTGRCTTMTGVESIHNVTVTLCVEARKDNPDAAFRDATRMLASVARSI